MLPADQRLTRPHSFRHAVKAGRRAGARTLVTHLIVDGNAAATGDGDVEGFPSRPRSVRIGFVVSKAVGSAVVRNRVKRRLRHAARERIAQLPDNALLVVRAQPPAAAASYQELVADLDRCLERSLKTEGSGQVAP